MSKPPSLRITPFFEIPLAELELSYARSSGPGGQNVNKVNSKAVLRWNLRASNSVPLILKGRLLSRLKTQLTVDGELVIASDRFRDQPKNREDCNEKLIKLLSSVAIEPKKRKETKPSRSSQRRVKEEKARNSRKKQLRTSYLTKRETP
jgi:ribosome-associated protein